MTEKIKKDVTAFDQAIDFIKEHELDDIQSVCIIGTNDSIHKIMPPGYIYTERIDKVSNLELEYSYQKTNIKIDGKIYPFYFIGSDRYHLKDTEYRVVLVPKVQVPYMRYEL